MKLKTIKLDEPEVVYLQNKFDTIHQKSFPLLGSTGNCQYQNNVNFEKILEEKIQDNKIKIINQLCTEKGDGLQKVTTIKFGDQIITIKDSYRFDRLGVNVLHLPSKKRIQIFKKPLVVEQNGNQSKSRLTKNLPKNFIKAFLNFLQDIKNESNKEILDCKIQLLSSRQKFNNSFIQRIVDDQFLEPYFRQFLQNHAQSWIKNSKIRNKDIHLQAINIFLNLKNKNSNGLGRPDSTNSFSNSQNSNQVEQQFQYSQNRNDQNIANSPQIQSQRDSILANQSQNYCIDQR